MLCKGRHQLLCEKAIYSFDDKYDNFRLAFDQLDIEAWKPKKVLLLGLGLASVPYLMEHKYRNPAHFVAVEIDDEIIRLAQKYTLDKMSSSFEIYNVDAADFIKFNNESFDLIAVDIFAEDIIPDKFKLADFVKELKDRLNPEGLVMYNQFALTSEDVKGSESFKEIFLNVFKEGTHRKVRNNMMLFSHSRHFKISNQ